MNAPRAIGTNAETQAKRNALYVYVRDHLYGDAPTDPVKLARRVSDAPARITLTGDEWWNVALFLAQKVSSVAGTDTA